MLKVLWMEVRGWGGEGGKKGEKDRREGGDGIRMQPGRVGVWVCAGGQWANGPMGLIALTGAQAGVVHAWHPTRCGATNWHSAKCSAQREV